MQFFAILATHWQVYRFYLPPISLILIISGKKSIHDPNVAIKVDDLHQKICQKDEISGKLKKIENGI